MGAFRVYGGLYYVWGPLVCMGPFSVYGALYYVWGPLGCMGAFTHSHTNFIVVPLIVPQMFSLDFLRTV